MDFVDKFRKKKVNTQDILVEEKKDRRLLSHVPDSTHKRSNIDRRAHDPSKKIEKYEDYILEQESGIRYITGFDVRHIDSKIIVVCIAPFFVISLIAFLVCPVDLL